MSGVGAVAARERVIAAVLGFLALERDTRPLIGLEETLARAEQAITDAARELVAATDAPPAPWRPTQLDRALAAAGDLRVAAGNAGAALERVRGEANRRGDDWMVTVCAACLTASCWHGGAPCEGSATAGTLEMNAVALVRLGREHPDHWRGQVRTDETS